VSARALRPLAPDGDEGAVFFLHGEDEFRKEEAARSLVESHVDPATRDFNLDQVRGSDLTLEALASLLGTPPMMANRRVVLLREVEGLATDARARELLVATTASPPRGLVLILVSSTASTAAFYRTLEKSARSAKFPSLGEGDVPGWLMERTRERYGRELDEDAALALAAGFGSELGLLARELEKLSAVAEDDAPISLATVEAAGVSLPTQNRWAWFDLVGEGRFLEALGRLPVLEAQGESGVGLVIGMASQLLRIGIVAEGGTRALEAILPPNQRWLARRVASQARNWSGPQVEEALVELRDVDQALKSGGGMGVVERWLLTWAVRRQAA
jgi:DNA polymerase III subunit delta